MTALPKADRKDNKAKRCIAAEIRIMAELPVELLETLQSISRTIVFETGQTIVREGEELSYVGAVTEGILRMQKTLPDGREHIVGLIVEGDMFGRVYDGPHHFSIEAATQTSVCAFQKAPFEDLLDRWPELERMVMLNILNELDSAREWMLILANHRTSERLAGFLIVLCRRWANVAKLNNTSGGNLEVNIPVSRTDLAHFLGSRPESVSRAFHALADDGYIRIKTPYEIDILDLEGLIDMCGMEEFTDNETFHTLRAGRS